MLRFCFALYEFGLEIKFMYGFANSLIQEFCEMQTRLLHIIEDQNFDHRDLEMFKDLNNLAYAAFYNSVGRPELAKIKLKTFFEHYGVKGYSCALPNTRYLTIGLYFYQMALANEKDDSNPSEKTKSVHYIICAHNNIRPVALKRDFEFRFYCYLIPGKLACLFFEFIYLKKIKWVN